MRRVHPLANREATLVSDLKVDSVRQRLRAGRLSLELQAWFVCPCDYFLRSELREDVRASKFGGPVS
jgi:hypothetical protein